MEPYTYNGVALEQLGSQNDEDSLLKESDLVSESEAKLSLWTALRRWPRVAWYSLALSSTIVLLGYDDVLVGSVATMPVFQEVYGEKLGDRYIIPSNWLAIWNVSSPIGGMSGALIAGWLGDRIGRRWMLAISTLLSAGAVVIFLVSDTPGNIGGRRSLFFIGEVVSGVGIGALTTTAQTYMSETVPVQLRGPILASIPAFQLVGQIIGSSIVQAQMNMSGRNSYRIAFGSIWAFSIIPLIASLLIPESPSWLLRKGKTDAAYQAHRRLEANKKYQGAYHASFARLQRTVARDGMSVANPRQDPSYLACLKGINLRRTWIVAFANILPELLGLSLLSSAGYYLQCIGIEASTANLFLIIGIAIGLIANICTFWILSLFGRRRLILVTLAPIVILWVSIGIVGSIQKQGKLVMWYTPVTMMVIIFIAGIGAWPASYVVAAETSSLRLRAKTSGIGWFFHGAVASAFGLGMPYVYNPDAGNLGAQTAFVVAGFAAFGLLLSYLFIPEMKDRTTLEIDRMFEIGLSTREFGRWREGAALEARRRKNLSGRDYQRVHEEA